MSINGVLKFVQNGDTRAIEREIAKGVDLNTGNIIGLTPLILAAGLDNVRMVDWLLDRGAQIDLADPHGRTALLHAIERLAINTSRRLLERGANPNHINANGLSPLFIASYDKNADMTRLLLEYHADVNYQWPPNNYNLLVMGNNTSSPERVRMLLEAGADPTLRDATGLTAFLNSASIINADAAIAIIDLFLEYGSSIDEVDQNGNSLLMLLVNLYSNDVGRIDVIVDHLLNLGADPNIINIEGENVLHMASNRNQTNVVEPLLLAGADPTGRNVNGYLPRDLANREINEILNHFHIPGPFEKNKDGVTNLMIVTQEEPYQLWGLLRQIKGDRERTRAIDIQDSRGNTALHYAAEWDDPRMAKILLDHGADPFVRNTLGWRPIDYAIYNRNKSVRAMFHDAEIQLALIAMGLSRDVAGMIEEYLKYSQMVRRRR